MKKQMLLQGLCAASLLLTVACQPSSLPPGTSPSPSTSTSPSPTPSGAPGSETPGGGSTATPAPTPTGSPIPAPPTTVGGGSVVIDAPAGTPVVNVAQVKSISVTAERFLSGGEGSTTTLTVSLKDAAGNPVTVDDISLVFESLDSRVFSISENGTVTALVDFGSGQIKVTEPTTGATTTINLSVSNASVSSGGGGGGGGGGSTASPTPTPIPTPTPTPSATMNLSLNYSGLGLNAFRANTTTEGAQYSPKVAMSASGSYVVVWTSAPALTGEQAQYWCDGDACINVVTEEQRVEGLVGPDGDGSGIFGQRYRADGVPIGPEFQINTFTRDNIDYSDSSDGETYLELNGQDTPDVAMNASGQFVVAWESDEQDSDENGIFAQRYDSAGQPIGGEFQVNSTSDDEQDNPSVALRNDGSFVIAWEHDDGEDTQVRYRAFGADGNPVSNEVTIANTDTSEVHAAASASGEVTIAWESEGDGFTEGTILEYQRLNASSAPIGSRVEVAPNTSSADAFDLGYLSNGRLVFGWAADGIAYYTVYSSTDTILLPAGSASQDSSGDLDEVSVATNGLDSFALSWESNSITDDYSVYSRVFTYSTGMIAPTSTSEMRVNEELGNIVMPRDNDRDTPHIAMTTSGDLVVVWEADLDHPADLLYGVFGKLLTQNGDVK